MGKTFLAVSKDWSGKIIKAEVTDPVNVAKAYWRGKEIIELPHGMTQEDLDNFIQKLAD